MEILGKDFPSCTKVIIYNFLQVTYNIVLLTISCFDENQVQPDIPKLVSKLRKELNAIS